MDPNWGNLGKLLGEKKLAITLDVTSAATQICADGIKAQSMGITEEELIEKVRERLEWSKRGKVRRIC